MKAATRSAARAAYVAYPFVAIVGQEEAKLAVTLAAINPRVGGVLLSGPKGIGKTSIVRGVAELLPRQSRSNCAYGCDPSGTALCESCASTPADRRDARTSRAELVELPVNAQIDDVVGTIDLRAALESGTVGFRPGLLARANRSMLYVDEINLLSDAIVDVLLDAAAQGVVRVKRGQQTVEYPSRFTFVGTMNPEEGELRPQITDRLGLRVFVEAAPDVRQRTEIYRRNAAFGRDPLGFVTRYRSKTRTLRASIARAIDLLPSVEVSEEAQAFAISSVMRLAIESHRAEFVALEAACALAAFEGRDVVTADDVRRVFPMATRLRRSRLRVQAFNEYRSEDALIDAAMDAASENEPGDAESSAQDDSGAVHAVSPDLTQRAPQRAKTGVAREGQAVETRPLRNGRVDAGATVLQYGIARRSDAVPFEAQESVDASLAPRLTVFIVDASQSTVRSADAVQAAIGELLRPIYTGRDSAALISCWGPQAEVLVDENLGRNVELVATRLTELDPQPERALTPLPDALERARRITERFLRSNPRSEVEITVFSDGRANVPLGGEAELSSLAAPGSDARALVEAATEQCKTLAVRLCGRATTTFVNLDGIETSSLMREMATLSRGRYFSLNDVVARLN